MNTRSRVAIGVGAVAAIVAALLLLRGCGPEDVTVIAVGDMACSPTDPQYGDGAGVGNDCQASRVSDAASAVAADALLGLGDYQYELPSAADFAQAYDPTWGRLRSITYPALGNQELKVHKANTFYDYFGERAGPRTGYYSYELGSWHVIVLNTNCTTVEGGCGPESPQVQWLTEDLSHANARCVLAYGHHPRWSNGIAGPDDRVGTLFSALTAGHVAMYLSGHESDYERFAPRDAKGQPDPQGTAQFVVGTGGQSLYQPSEGDAPWRAVTRPVPGEYFQATDHGFLVLDLKQQGYTWSYQTADGGVLDSGAADCPDRR